MDRWLLILPTIVVLAMLHELGHYIPMRHFGVELDKVGFGSFTRWRWKIRGITMELGLVPLKAYVSMSERGYEVAMQDPIKYLWISAGGPIMSVLISAILLGVAAGLNGGFAWMTALATGTRPTSWLYLWQFVENTIYSRGLSAFLLWAGFINLINCAVNVFPPRMGNDGGSILTSLVYLRTPPARREVAMRRCFNRVLIISRCYAAVLVGVMVLLTVRAFNLT